MNAPERTPDELPPDARRAIAAALAEDEAGSDVTAAALVPPGARGAAEIRVKEAGVVAGLRVAREVFAQVDPSLAFHALARDGDRIDAGGAHGRRVAVARIEGSLRSLLAGERVALNFMQRMSGIATTTARFVAAVHGTGAAILATRKTAPGLRAFDVAAVRAGGGGVHRGSLGERVLVKENHVRAARIAGTAGDMAAVAARIAAHASVRIGLEAADRDELRAALLAPGVDVVLLDNFTPAECREAVALRDALCAARGPRTPALEASGGITLATVAAYASSGVERISVGALTHSAPALDLSMTVLE